MAKRGIMGKAKVYDLAQELGIPRLYVVGVLEIFWHWVATTYRDGEITKARPEHIKDALAYPKDAAKLLAALIKTGFVDRLDDGRLIVHDWSEHADNTVHQTLKKAGKTFADGHPPFSRTKTKKESPEVESSQTESEPKVTADTNETRSVSHCQKPEARSQKPEASASSRRPESMDAVAAHLAVQCGVPPDEAAEAAGRFWSRHEKNGWTIKGEPIQSWQSALDAWYRYDLEHRHGIRTANGGGLNLNGATTKAQRAGREKPR